MNLEKLYYPFMYIAYGFVSLHIILFYLGVIERVRHVTIIIAYTIITWLTLMF